MIEVEQKYHVGDISGLVRRLEELGATEQRHQQQQDTYFNHPCRDFAETREALRVRRIDGVPLITYKGHHAPGDIKAREELEWELGAGDSDGSKTESLLKLLGFREVATVKKRRRSFTLPGDLSDLAVVIDDVVSVGNFSEIELLVGDSTEVDAARRRIRQLSERLKLDRPEQRSYLAMFLESDNPQNEALAN